MKKCAICKIPKTISEFHKKKDAKDGLMFCCKECNIKRGRQHYYDNIEHYKQYRINNVEKIKEKNKKYRESHKEEARKLHKEYRRKNIKKIKEKKKEYYKINAEKIKQKVKKYRKNNPEKVRKSEKKKIYNRRKMDPVFRLNGSISKRINSSLKGRKNGRHWETLVDYTQEELRNHLESQFKEGMTWDNYGKWHIDHKIPISLFNITSEKCKGFKACWALENLQPMWAKENILKSNKIFVDLFK